MKYKLLAYFSRFFLNLLLLTCRFRIEGLSNFLKVAKEGPCILMLWHNRLLITGYILSKFTKDIRYVAFVSNSRDGRILAEFVESHRRARSIKVAHNARGSALKTLINDLKHHKDVVLITPDGPRGPKYGLKPGVVKAAEETNAETIPLSWSASSFWQLNTWDNLIIPKPFSTIYVFFGPKVEESFKKSLNYTTEKVCSFFNKAPI